MSRIAIFTNSIYTMGGEQRVVSIMANEFVKKHDVTIFTMDPLNKNENMFQLSSNVKVERYLPYQGDMISFAFRAMTHLTPWIVYDMFPIMLERAYCHKKYAKRMYELIGEKYDVVIATAWQLSIILGQVCQRYPHHFISIGWEHSSFEAYFREKYIYLYNYENFFKENVKYLDHVVVLNHDFAEKYKEFLNIDCEIIYNPKSFSSIEKSNLNEKRFVACGRFDSCKGFDLLIEAFSIYAQKEKEWKLVIAGEGNMLNKIKEQVNHAGLEQRVILPGHVSNVRTLLQQASVYLLSSRFEGFPMCVTEAYEIGLPLVAFDIPAVIPFKERGAAKTAECYNVQKFAELMFEIANNYDERCRMSSKALEIAGELAPERIVKDWEVLMKKKG